MSLAKSFRRPRGLDGWSAGTCQYSPSCFPALLGIFCAYWPAGLSSSAPWKYRSCAFPIAEMASIASSSFFPMRRARISSPPAGVSKYHLDECVLRAHTNNAFQHTVVH